MCTAVSNVAASADRPWHWECERGISAIRRLAPEWNRLSHAGELNPWGDALWMECYWSAFAKKDEDLVVHALFYDDQLVAAVPLLRRAGLLPAWSHVGNAHSSYWSIALDENRLDAVGRVLEHLLSTVAVLDVRPTHSNGPIARSLVAAARERGLRVAVEEYSADALMDVPGSWEQCRQSLSKNLRSDTPRKLRGLQKLGTLEFAEVGEGATLDGVLEECYRLETLGWKGQTGSPISSRPDTLRFYTELAHAAGRAGRFALYTLRLDGRLIAFEYCLRAQRTIEMMKLSFDPALSSQSPGNVLRFLLLEKEAAKGEIATYHMGPPADASGWKLRWATRVEPLARLRVYAPQMKAALSYHLGPHLRATLKRSERLRRAVVWARSVAGQPPPMKR